MIKITNDSYLLSPIIDHKLKYDLGGIEIQIEKQYENNLRLRNCQLGIVEAIPAENPLSLSLGDIVFVHHLTFQRGINRGMDFIKEQHVLFRGKELYQCPARSVFFKYNEKTITPTGDVVIVEGVKIPAKELYEGSLEYYPNMASVVFPTEHFDEGDILFVETHAMYPIDLPGCKFFKIYRSEIVAQIGAGNVVVPGMGRVVVLDEDAIVRSTLDLSMVPKEPTVKSKIVALGSMHDEKRNKFLDPNCLKLGQRVLRARASGTFVNGVTVLNILDGSIKGVLC